MEEYLPPAFVSWFTNQLPKLYMVYNMCIMVVPSWATMPIGVDMVQLEDIPGRNPTHFGRSRREIEGIYVAYTKHAFVWDAIPVIAVVMALMLAKAAMAVKGGDRVGPRWTRTTVLCIVLSAMLEFVASNYLANWALKSDREEAQPSFQQCLFVSVRLFHLACTLWPYIPIGHASESITPYWKNKIENAVCEVAELRGDVKELKDDVEGMKTSNAIAIRALRQDMAVFNEAIAAHVMAHPAIEDVPQQPQARVVRARRAAAH